MSYPDSGESKPNPSIEPTVNGPYMVNNLKDFTNSKGEVIKTQTSMFLCRCGGSSNKPFCDGTHLKIRFSGDKSPNRVPDKVDDYVGNEITIHDNRGVCAHFGYCTDNSPAVFSTDREPWIDPDVANARETATTIRMCPSGALSYTQESILWKDDVRSAAIHITRNGPYRVVGGIEFNDTTEDCPESREHYTLCRCGASKNKPFCNGQHWYIGFTDDKN